MKMAGCCQNGKKTMWEKEKLLVMSNFSFSHDVLKGLMLQTHKNQGLFGKGLEKKKATKYFARPKRKENHHTERAECEYSKYMLDMVTSIEYKYDTEDID